MNAIKFIKQHGVDKAREVVSGVPDGATHLSDDTRHYVNADFKPLPTHIKEQLPKLIVIDDIERMVKSVDLIDSLGGLELSKKESNDCRFYEYADMSHRAYAIKQAIADYEQLFGNTETSELETLRNCDTSPNCKKFDERVK